MAVLFHAVVIREVDLLLVDHITSGIDFAYLPFRSLEPFEEAAGLM